jgi:Subunit 11 of the general transcription factor TFIIH
MHINRRYVKKYGLVEPGDEVVGYQSMGQLCKDLEGVIDIVWLSGTREFTRLFHARNPIGLSNIMF